MKRITLAVTLSLVCTAASLLVGQAIADDAKTPSPMDELGKFVGVGTCTGNVLAMGKSSGHATTGKYHGEKTLDGHWIVIHYDEDKTDVNPTPYHVQQYFSYDPEKKMFVAVAFDNMGPGYSPATSAGWKGDTFTLEYTASVDGKTVSMRDVFTHNAAENSHTGMMRDKSGEWVKTDKETCKSS
jgi:Protein of unknown function (DUF1579)